MMPTLIGAIGPNQILIIILIVVLLFGAKKIPELMKGVGQGIREFKDAKDNTDKDRPESEKKKQ